MNPRIDELRQRLDREPGSRLFAQLAEELRKDGDVAGAIKVCREGLAKHPAYPSAHMTLGRALLDGGDFAGARSEFESVLKGAPDNILASRFLGECLEGLGDLPGAIARFKTTLQMSPGDRAVTSRLESLEGQLRQASVSKPIPVVQVDDESFEIEGPDLQASTLSPGRRLEGEEPAPRVELGAGFGDTTPGVVVEPEAPAVAFEPHAPAEPEPDTLAFGATYDPSAVGGAAPSVDPVFEFDGPVDAVGEEPGLVVEPEPAPQPEPAIVHDANLSTPTLAELYFNQGFADKAIEVYRDLLSREPGNTRAAARIIEIEAIERQLKDGAPLGVVATPPPAAAAPREAPGPPAAAAPPTGAPGVPGGADPRALRRQAIERTIARLEQMRLMLRRA